MSSAREKKAKTADARRWRARLGHLRDCCPARLEQPTLSPENPGAAMASESAADAGVYRRRHEKRLDSIEVVKRSANYLSYSASVPRANRSDGEPRTPSPGATASARRFRYEIKLWKQGLYEWNARRSVLE